MSEKQEVSQLTYQDKLKEVRVLPQLTNEEKEAKRDAARDLRIETTLSWASFAYETVEVLTKNPNISSPELRKTLSKHKDAVSRPDIAHRFMVVLESAKVKKNEALGLFRQQAGLKPLEDNGIANKWSDYDQQEVGERIFRSITKKRPTGKVELLFTPLAVVIKPKEKKDFKMLDNRENVAGYYNHSQAITPQNAFYANRESIRGTFPLIVISSYDPELIRHEIGHGINRAMIDTLAHLEEDPDTPPSIWGNSDKIPKIEDKPKTIPDLEVALREKAVPYALARAKDEVITDFVSSGNFQHLDNLKTEGYVYDYLDEVVNSWFKRKKTDIVPEWVKSVKSRIWREYVEKLTNAVDSAKKLANQYGLNHANKRFALLPYVLAQIPIQHWNFNVQGRNEKENRGKRKSSSVLQDFHDEMSVYAATYQDVSNLASSYNRTLGRSSDRSLLIELLGAREIALQELQWVSTDSIYTLVGNLYKAADQFTRRTGYSLREARSLLGKR